MSDRDATLNIIGHDRTGAASRSAGRNLDQLKRKVKDVNDENGKMGKVAAKAGGDMASSLVSAAATVRAAAMPAAIAAIGVALLALPTAAAVAGMGLVLGLGGGLLAIGIKAALMNKQVQSAFSRTKEHVVAELQQMAKPFEPVLIRIAQRARATFDSFAPVLSASFKSMAPVLDTFSKDFFKSLEQLKPAIKPLTDSFNQIIGQIGPKLPGIMKAIADSIIDITDALKKNPGAIDNVIDGLRGLITWTGNVIEWLIRANAQVDVWVSGFQVGVLDVKIALQTIAAGFADMVAKILAYGAKIPGPMGDQFRKMAASARAEADRANAALQSMKTDKSRAQVELLQAHIRQLKGKKVLTEVDKGEIRRSRTAIETLRMSIAGLQSKTVTIKTHFLTVGSPANANYSKARSASYSAAGSTRSYRFATSRLGEGRVGGATPVSVTTGPTTVDARLFLDGEVIRSVARTVVRDAGARRDHRVKYGRR